MDKTKLLPSFKKELSTIFRCSSQTSGAPHGPPHCMPLCASSRITEYLGNVSFTEFKAKKRLRPSLVLEFPPNLKSPLITKIMFGFSVVS
jgi:hypothetical protein